MEQETTMHIRISTIAENSASWLKLLAEWGLSILVEVDDTTILMDTGYSIVAAHNARIMGEDLSKVDKIVFSHGHEDHTGGLPEILKLRNLKNKPVEIIAHPDVWKPKVWRSPDGTRFDEIGIPYSREYAEELGATFFLSKEPVWITDHIVTSGEVPMVTDFEKIDYNACVKTVAGVSDDPLDDDQTLFIKSDKGLIVISGCAHRGIINTIIRGKELTGSENVYAVIGGIHLFGADEERLQKTIDEFRRLDIQHIGVSHCTGQIASARLFNEFGDKFFFNMAGTCTEFEV